MQKKKSNYKGKKFPRRNNGGGSKRDVKTRPSDVRANAFEEGSYDSSRNDWRWYATNPQLVKDSASYPYAYPLGMRNMFGPYGAEANKNSLPGVCSLGFVPTIGYSDNPNSPVNVASRSIYGDIRSTNSGGTNYDPVDMMVYLISMDSAYMALEYFKRVYGVMRLVSPVNRYIPRALVIAMGIDFDDINANLDDFRAAINTYAQKLKALCIPNGMSYMAKHQWMVSGVYQDHPTDKSQYYIFTPHVFFKFKLDSDGAGACEAVSWPIATLHTFSDCLTLMSTLLDPILANQDFAIMSGDILKWRGMGGVVVPTGITEDYQIFPVFDESVLDQIQNGTLLGIPWTSFANPKSLRIVQDATKSYLVSTPWFRHPYKWESDWANPGRNAYMVKRYVNFTHDGITPEETMEATRLSNIATEVELDSSGYDYFKVPTLASEALTTATLWYYAEESGDWVLKRTPSMALSEVDILELDSTDITQSTLTDMAEKTRNIMVKIQMLENFYRHPAIALSTGVLDTSATLEPRYGTFSGYMEDINYYSIIDVEDLQQMAEIALMSMFNVRMQ